ncbi:hypothetical protein CHD2B1_038 [Escherichia phage vB_EcoS-CHD2B1]|nr:hypothetical protein CHD2B1_038 [Escherichia phage vB_EcoS-CHD2B1]
MCIPIQISCIKQTGQKAGQTWGGTKRDSTPSPSVLPRVSADRDRRDNSQSFRLDGGQWPPSSETE